MKKKYLIPEIEIIELNDQDVIIMSETTGDVEWCEITGTCEDVDPAN